MKLTYYFTPRTLDYNNLPTYLDIYKYFLFIKTTNINDSKIITLEKILDIWYRASLPTFDRNYVLQKLTHYMNVVDKLIKNINNVHFYKSFKDHALEYNKLFDICPCKCEYYCICPEGQHLSSAKLLILKYQRDIHTEISNASSTIKTSIQSRYILSPRGPTSSNFYDKHMLANRDDYISDDENVQNIHSR